MTLASPHSCLGLVFWEAGYYWVKERHAFPRSPSPTAPLARRKAEPRKDLHLQKLLHPALGGEIQPRAAPSRSCLPTSPAGPG